MVLPSIFSRIGGLLVPLILAIAFFNEMPTLLQVIGSFIAMGSIILINSGAKEDTNHKMMPLLILFVVEGFASVMSKVYNELGHNTFPDHFLFYTFLVAVVLTTLIALSRKEKFGLSEVIFGLGIGIPNFLSSRFLLLALQSIPSIIAYPIKSVGTMIVVSLAGLLIFKEKLSKKQWIALVAIVIAIALLNM